MSTLRVCLFGKFSAEVQQRALAGLEGNKVQELLSYLLLYRERPHSREALATLLWADSPATQSKKNLRQSLWQLQSALESQSGLGGDRVLRATSEWIQLNPDLDLWLDVAVFEQACALVQGLPADRLTAQDRQTLEQAVQLYHGDLLEGCYQDWCLYERERLQQQYLALLEKLMRRCELEHDYEAGLLYGGLILRLERASERTHRRLMRLLYQAGDRTAALRQFERCRAVLEEEFGVQPSRRTLELYDLIRADQLGEALEDLSIAEIRSTSRDGGLPDALSRLKQLGSVLADIQHEIQNNIQMVERSLHNRR